MPEIAPPGHMLNAGPLLVGQHKSPRFGAFDCPVPRGLRHAVSGPQGEAFAGLVKLLLHLQHLPGGEALFTPSVASKCDALRRGFYCRQDCIELLDAVRMAVHEQRQVTLGERRVLAGDRIQCNSRIGDNPRAVLAGDLAMLFEPIRLRPRLAHARCGRADFVLRFEVDPLRFQRAMIDPRIDAEFRSRSLTWTPQSSRHRSRSWVRFHSRTLAPKPLPSTVRMDSMTWACGRARPSSPISNGH